MLLRCLWVLVLVTLSSTKPIFYFKRSAEERKISHDHIKGRFIQFQTSRKQGKGLLGNLMTKPKSYIPVRLKLRSFDLHYSDYYALGENRCTDARFVLSPCIYFKGSLGFVSSSAFNGRLCQNRWFR